MGKISNLATVIGNFFVDGETLTPGQALARVNKSTNSNNLAIYAVASNGAPEFADAAVNFELREIDETDAGTLSSSAATSGEVITGVTSTNAWTFQTSVDGAAAADIDTANSPRKGSTLIDQILESKTRPDGYAGKATSAIYVVCWSQDREEIIVCSSSQTKYGTQFADMTPDASGRDFGE